AGTLFHATLAFHCAGDRKGEQQAWNRLAADAGNKPLRIGAHVVSLEELRQELDREPRAGSLGADWPVFRGSPNRLANAHAAAPFLEPRGQTETISEPLTRVRVDQAIAHLNRVSQPVLPAFFPIVVDGKLVYRSYRGIHAVALKTGAPAWSGPV